MLLLVTNQLWQISFFQPIWNNFSDGLTIRLRVLRVNMRKVSRVNCPKLVKMANFKPPYLYKKWSQVKYFFQISAQDNISFQMIFKNSVKNG